MKKVYCYAAALKLYGSSYRNLGFFFFSRVRSGSTNLFEGSRILARSYYPICGFMHSYRVSRSIRYSNFRGPFTVALNTWAFRRYMKWICILMKDLVTIQHPISVFKFIRIGGSVTPLLRSHYLSPIQIFCLMMMMMNNLHLLSPVIVDVLGKPANLFWSWLFGCIPKHGF